MLSRFSIIVGERVRKGFSFVYDESCEKGKNV